MNAELYSVLCAHADWFINRFGETKAEHYLFPFGKPTPSDPTKPITDITGAWDALRGRAQIKCQLHDLRYTAATKMAEAGVPESTMLALMGHMSRAMLEQYSHIRMAAKREAVEALSTASKIKMKKVGRKKAGKKKTGNSKVPPTKVPTLRDTAKIHLA